MSMIKSLKNRRSYYDINKNLPVTDERVIEIIQEVVTLVPDAFNMKSAKVYVVMGEKQNELWDAIFDIFNGEVEREKVDSFKAGAGTILYFIDQKIVKSLQEQYEFYADNFPVWSNQANGMLQLAIWSALRDEEIGASLQHYNPVIDNKIKEMFKIPEYYKLVAQMPFGGIVSEPEAKEQEDPTVRTRVVK